MIAFIRGACGAVSTARMPSAYVTQVGCPPTRWRPTPGSPIRTSSRSTCWPIRGAAAAACIAGVPAPTIGQRAVPRARTSHARAGGWTPTGTFHVTGSGNVSGTPPSKPPTSAAGPAARARVLAAGRGSGSADRTQRARPRRAARHRTLPIHTAGRRRGRPRGDSEPHLADRRLVTAVATA